LAVNAIGEKEKENSKSISKATVNKWCSRRELDMFYGALNITFKTQIQSFFFGCVNHTPLKTSPMARESRFVICSVIYSKHSTKYSRIRPNIGAIVRAVIRTSSRIAVMTDNII
jgi:hypothetical protein